MPAWSLDPKSGIWKLEETATINYNSSNDKFEVTFGMTHLSYWTICWTYPPPCAIGAKVVMSSSFEADNYGYYALRDSTGAYFSEGVINLKNGSSLRFNDVPPSTPMSLIIYGSYADYLSKTAGQTTSVSNLCAGTIPVTYAGTPPPTINVTVNASCASAPDQVIRPTVTIYAKVVGTDTWTYVGEMVDGKISTNAIKQGFTYNVATVIGDDFFISPDNYTVSQTDYDIFQILPDNICALLN